MKSDFQLSHSNVVAGYGTYTVATGCNKCGSLLRSSKDDSCVSCRKRASSLAGNSQYEKRLLIDRRIEEMRVQREIEQEYTTYAI